jgi:chromate transporter
MRSEDFWALLFAFVPLSLMAIGGNLAILGGIQHQAVDIHRWLSPQEFVDYFAISRAAPGPGSMIVTIIGWKIGGFPGAIVATLALYLPSSMLCLAVSRVWTRYSGRAWHTAIQNGLVPVAAGLLWVGIASVLEVAHSWLALVLALAAFAVLLRRPRVNPLILLAFGAAIAVAVDAISTRI